MKLLQQLLTEENANSRFVYLITNVAVVISVLALVGASIWKGVGNSSSQNIVLDAYIFLIGVLLSGGVGGAAGPLVDEQEGLAVHTVRKLGENNCYREDRYKIVKRRNHHVETN